MRQVVSLSRGSLADKSESIQLQSLRGSISRIDRDEWGKESHLQRVENSLGWKCYEAGEKFAGFVAITAVG